MAPAKLEAEDHQRDAEFNRILHGKSAEARGGFLAMRSKDAKAQKAAVDEYFKHWDNKSAETETEEIREVSRLAGRRGLSAVLTGDGGQARRAEYATLTRQYAQLYDVTWYNTAC